MNRTSIEWTDFTWNPIRARSAAHELRTGTFCTKISPGCKNCYASVINRRFGTGEEYEVPNLARHKFFLDENILAEPVRRQKPARIFVGDMFDLWHEAIPDHMIAEVLRVALKTPRHTFQFLTKRAERMQRTVNFAQEHWGVKFGPHMWFGVSVEDQQRHDERAPLLQETHCAVRFLSVEPMLENIALGIDTPEVGWISTLTGFNGTDPDIPGIDWVICGGESGPGARPFNLAWAESLLSECRAANVPFFMKQAGSNAFAPNDDYTRIMCTGQPGTSVPWAGKFIGNKFLFHFHDRKGGNPCEWPEHLRVREFPNVQEREAVNA